MLAALLKKLLFRQWIKNIHLQPFWRRLHTVATYAMNYQGGGDIRTSGEVWVVEHVVRAACMKRREAVVFDVGANVGDFALLVARHVPAARIYAFEPSRNVHATLEERVRGHPGIVPLSIGFSDAPGTAILHSYTADGVEDCCVSSIDRRRPTQVVSYDVSGREEIEVRTIDGFCAERGIAFIDLLKLDVEGHELAVLRGAERMLASGAVSIIQFEFGPANIGSSTYLYDFWAMLSGAYDLFRIVPKGIVPIPFYGEHLEVFLTTNYLAVRREEAAA